MADDIASIGYKADLTGINKINKGLDSVADTSVRTEKVMDKSMSGVGKSAGQASIQLQQFVGQVQGGVNPMIALSQQAADLGIVLGAPLVGSIVGIAAAVGASFIPAMMGAASQTEELTEKLLDLVKASTLTEAQSAFLVSQTNDEIEANRVLVESSDERIASLERTVSLYDSYQDKIEDGVKLTTAERRSYKLLGADIDETRDKLLAETAARDTLNNEYEKLIENKEIYSLATKKSIDQQDSEISSSIKLNMTIDDLIDSYTLKTEVIGKTKAEADLYIASQRLGVEESSNEYLAIKRVIDEYYRKVDALKAVKQAQSDLTTAISVEAVLAYQQYGAAMVEASKIQQEQVGVTDDLYFAYTQYADAMLEAQEIQADAPDSDEYFNSIIDGSLEAVNGLHSLAEAGTDAYEDLSRLSTAMQGIQALSTGNFAGAAVAGLGLLMSFGGELEDLSEGRQETQGLNKFGEKADSIAVATEITANATEDLVGINSDMLKALTTLQSNLASAASIIAGDTEIPQVSVDVSNELDAAIDFGLKINDAFTDLLDFGTGALDIFDDLLGGLSKSLGSLLGGSSKVSDEGIKIIGGTMQELIDNTMVLAYQSVSYKKWKFGSTKHKTATKDISDDVGAQFSLVFASLADAVYVGATSLGLDEHMVEKAIQDFEIDDITISLMGLSAEEQAEEISAVFSDIFNDLTEEVVPWISDLQNAGEELGETLARVATEVAIADYLVDVFGITFGDKMADPEAYAKAADNLAELVGGVEALSSTTAAFIDAFATDEQQLEILSSALEESLGAVGLTLPDTAEGMWDLMASLDGSTEAGQEQIAALLLATETADAYYQILGRTQSAMADLSDSFASTVMDIYDMSDGIEQVSLDAALAAARMGDFSLAEELNPSDYDLDESDFATIADFNVAQAEAANKLLELSQLSADAAGDVETQQLNELKSINMNLTKALEESNQLMRTQNRLQAESANNLDEINNIGVRDRDGATQ